MGVRCPRLWLVFGHAICYVVLSVCMVARYVRQLSGYLFGYVAYGYVCKPAYPGKPKVARIMGQNLRDTRLDTLIRTHVAWPCP